MPTSVQQRLLGDAEAYAPLTALLGGIGSPPTLFRWYWDQLQQGSAYPAVVVQQISGSKSYSATVRMNAGFGRYQFTIWGGQYAAGAAARDAVESALASFLDQWSGGTGITGLPLYSNRIIGERETLFVQKDTPVYCKQIDVMIFSDDTI